MLCSEWFGKHIPMKEDCEHVFQIGNVSQGQIKGVIYNNSDSVADLLIGRGGQGLNVGPNRKKGMLVYVQQMVSHCRCSLWAERI